MVLLRRFWTDRRGSFKKSKALESRMEIDLSKLDARTREVLDGKFKDDFHRSVDAAIRRQTASAKAIHDQPHLWKDDFGPMRLNVDPFIDAYMSQVYGPRWKEDKALIRWFVNRGNEEILGHSVSPKITVGYSPKPRQKPGGARFDRGTMNWAK
jgi:hypothetical protein